MSTAPDRTGWNISLMAVCLASALSAQAQETPVAIGISGWTGFAPLILADKAYDMMGAAVKTSGKAFAESARYLRWQDREQNRVFFSGEIARFSEEASKLLLEAKVIRQQPDLSALYDASYVK